MKPEFEVSFNSPQCGWMSVGFKHSGGEFNTTTAHAPHKNALSEILNTITALLSNENGFKSTLAWNRDPEEYDFEFSKDQDAATIRILEYPTTERNTREKVFEYTGEAIEIARSFAKTFEQLYDERDIDEFEENWGQRFPYEEYENLKMAVENYG